jgi:fructosamine-3-kinase
MRVFGDNIARVGVDYISSSEVDDYCLARRSIFYPKSDLKVADSVLSSLQETKRAEAILNTQVIAERGEELFGERPSSVTPLPGQGTFHSLYKLRLHTVGDAILRTSVSTYPYRSFDFYIEAWVADRLRQEGLPVPSVYKVDISREKVSFDYQLSAEATGSTLKSFDIEGQKQEEHLLFELGSLLAKLHHVSTRKFGLLDIRCILDGRECEGLLQTWSEYVFLKLEDHLKTCFEIGAISLEDRKKIESIFEKMQPRLDCAEPALLHGDLSNSNVFSDGRCVTALVDWEDCLSGDPLFDIASWGTFIGNDERRELFLEGYRSARRLPDDFELKYWLYYLRVLLAKTVHRHRFRYHDRIPASSRIERGLKELEWLIPRGF